MKKKSDLMPGRVDVSCHPMSQLRVPKVVWQVGDVVSCLGMQVVAEVS